MSNLKSASAVRNEEIEFEGDDVERDLIHLDELDGICGSTEIETDKRDAQTLEQVGDTVLWR